MPRWYQAVMGLPSDAARDYMRLVLFTGMRRSEAAGMLWANVDFGRRVFTVPVTKNGDPLVGLELKMLFSHPASITVMPAGCN